MALVREHDRDRYFATLFAPESARADLFALYAFNLELARVRDLVSDPLPGEVRLQWWRDLLAGEARGDAAANPVAAALLLAIERNHLPRQAFLDMIEARTADLYDDPVPDWTALEGYCGATGSALIRLASIVLAEGKEPGAAAVAGHAGVALALTGLLRNLPWHAGQGRVLLPQSLLREHGLDVQDVLARADTPALRAVLAAVRTRARAHLQATRDARGEIAARIVPAFLPCALVEPYLDLMERPDYQPFRSQIAWPDWRKLLRLWRQSRRATR